MTKRDEQREQRRELIMEKAMDIFIQNGYSGTKISDIAQAADMSVGLMFHYFESKEVLYEELVKLGIEGPMKAMSIQCASPIEFFEEAAKQILTYIAMSPAIAKMFVFMSRTQRSGDVPQRLREMSLQIDNIEKSVELIKAGQQLGQIRDGNPMALSVAFWYEIQAIGEYAAFYPNQPLPEYEWIVDIIRRK